MAKGHPRHIFLMKIKKKPVKKSPGGASSASWKYFDDCLICQAMEKADKQGRSLSGKELKEAFDDANKAQKKRGK